MRLKCRCTSAQECPAEPINIEGTGILHHTGGRAFCTDQLLLPGSCQFESQAQGIGPEPVVPQVPDLLPKREVSCTRANQTHNEGVSERRNRQFPPP